MIEQEWNRIAAEILASWPHSELGDATLAVWRSDLDDLSAEQVLATIRAIRREGREFPPNGGQIRARLIEAAIDAPDHGDAYAIAMEAASRRGEAAGLGWLQENHPVVAETCRRYGWREFCRSTISDGTRRAQFRDIHKIVLEQIRTRGAEAGLPVGRGEPARLGTIMRELEPGSEEEAA